MNDKGADGPPVSAPPAAGVRPAAEAGGSTTHGSPATPVTTERRTPETRIQPGDHVRDMSEGQRTGIVKATLGYRATVQWSDGAEQDLMWGYLERVPAPMARGEGAE